METHTMPTAPSPTTTVLFLGTGAADWKPGQDRAYASALVDGHALIDCGRGIPGAMGGFDVSPAAITDVLITHTHGDHFDADAVGDLARIREGAQPLRLWAERAAFGEIPEIEGVEPHPIEIAKPFDVGCFRVTPLQANHTVEGSEETALHYLFETEACSFLYATDGAWLLKPTWQHLRQAQLDAIIWDATIGDVEGDWRIFEHNSLDMIRVMAKTLRRQGVLKPAAKIVLTHMARTLHPDHEELERTLIPEGLLPAYDGMRLAV